MLSMVNFHCKTIRNAANITANFEKSRSKISHFRPQKSEKSPAKSRRDCVNVKEVNVPSKNLNNLDRDIYVLN